MTSMTVFQVDNPALDILDDLAVLLVGGFQCCVATCVKSWGTLGFHCGGKGVFENSFTFGLIDHGAVFRETGDLFDHTNMLILGMTATVRVQQ